MAEIRNPSRRRDDGRRTQLIQAATRVIAKEGIAAATIRRITEEAGVPGSLVHYWFADKDELLQEVLLADLDSVSTAVTEAAETGDDLLGRLRAAFHVIEQDDRGRQVLPYELTTWALRKPEFVHVARKQYAAYRELGTETIASWVQATGAQLPADVPVVGQLITSLFDGLVLAWLADPDNTDVDAVLRLAHDLLSSSATHTPDTPDVPDTPTPSDVS
ncbi:TetR/AcrR family transcriptional regulator [Streptomyces sp. NPDC001389]|uniref:TetR/AcrR family transcriptional regulator n=1 Tax=unclassified Streptomyces TaxID=2593676 RepID=UPI0036B0FDD5